MLCVVGCPEKTFGKSCHKCNCKTDCNQENGTCGTQCLDGWHGPNCQMRKKKRIHCYHKKPYCPHA